ncbi:hypothetical protein ACQ4M3_01275 [Leptolyngbya sp. AN03gr2]
MPTDTQSVLNIDMPRKARKEVQNDSNEAQASSASSAKKSVSAGEASRAKSAVKEKTQSNSPRSAQFSISSFDQTLLKVLATIGGTAVSAMIRDILSPYLEFAKQTLKEQGCINDIGLFSMTPEEITKRFEAEVTEDPEKYLRLLYAYGEKHKLDIESWVKPEKLM